jgi:hypothetical protein
MASVDLADAKKAAVMTDSVSEPAREPEFRQTISLCLSKNAR